MTDIMKLAQEYAVRYRVNRAVDEARAALQSAIEALQSSLGDAIQSSAHWQHQFTEAQAENVAMNKQHIERLLRIETKVDELIAERDQLQVENERLKAEREALRDSAKEVTRLRDQLQSQLDAMGKGEPVALEDEMLDAAISWCDSNGINVLGPEQLSSLVNSLCITVRDAAPKALAPLTDKEDWDVRGILASKLRVFHRTTEAEAEELISLFSSMKSRTPLTQPEVVEAFCNTRHNTQYVSVFDAGVRFAEKHHGIGGTP